MDIQEVFYFTATVAMILTILFLLGMVALLFYIKKKVVDLDNYGKHVIHKADDIVEGARRQVRAITQLRTTILGKSQK